jgi:hypothetical protein
MFQTGPDAINLTGLGSTGLLIYLVVKEALTVGGKKRNGKSSGELSAEWWELKFTEIVEKQMEPLCRLLESNNEKLDRVLKNQIDTQYAIAQLVMQKGIMPKRISEEE